MKSLEKKANEFVVTWKGASGDRRSQMDASSRRIASIGPFGLALFDTLEMLPFSSTLVVTNER